MSASIHQLHTQSPPLSGFLRIGRTGHRKLEDLVAAGRCPYRRVVFDAAHIDSQLDLVQTFVKRGAEIVLDPNFAEMSACGKFASKSLSALSWSNADRPWHMSDFGRSRNRDTAKLIAEFVVSRGVHVVLAPSHYLDGIDDGWNSIDRAMCCELRHELDMLGGKHVVIDHQLILDAAVFRKASARRAVTGGMLSLPVENIWLRITSFGATASGTALRSFIEGARDLHSLGKPLIADFAGGLAGLGAAALGSVGGISHGLAQKESLRGGSEWRRIPPPERKMSGAAKRIYVPELDRHLNERQVSALFEAKGGKARFACNDTRCCRNGAEDMKSDPSAHFIYQRMDQLENLSKIPEQRRGEQFLLRFLAPAIRSARLGTKMKVADESLVKILSETRTRLEKMNDVLSDLMEHEAEATRSLAVAFRGGGSKPMAAILGA